MLQTAPVELDNWPTVARAEQEGGPKKSSSEGLWYAAFAVVIGVGAVYLGEGRSIWIYAFVAGSLGVMALIHFREALSMRRTETDRELRRGDAPDQPWKWDYPWNGEYSEDRNEMRWRHANVALAISVACAIVANIEMPKYPDSGTTLVLVNTLFIAIAGRSLYYIVRRLKFGRTRARFRDFPFHIGGSCDVVVSGDHWLRHADSVNATLRYVDELYATVGRRHRKSRDVLAYEGYRADVTVDPSAIGGPEQTHVELHFDIPEDGFPCMLYDNPPHYWDLEVNVVSRGVDYSGHFLMPVYARQSSCDR